MNQYHVIGRIEYMLFCPKAPSVDLCDPPQACPGHVFPAEADCYVSAPDELRAEHAALKKLASAYPWPVFAEAPEIIEAELPTTRGAREASRIVHQGDYLPGFTPEAGESGAVTLSYGDRSVTLRRNH